jgi:hypothetical protein
MVLPVGAGCLGSVTKFENLMLVIMAIFIGVCSCCHANVDCQQNTVCSINKKAILKMLF